MAKKREGPQVPGFAEHLAVNLRAVRAEKEPRMSQAALAEGMTELGHGWSQTTVGLVEKVARSVSVDELFGLAVVLDVPVARLLDPRGEETEIGLPSPVRASHVRPWLHSVIRIARSADGAYDIRAADDGWLPLAALSPETFGNPPPTHPIIAEHQARIAALRDIPGRKQ